MAVTANTIGLITGKTENRQDWIVSVYTLDAQGNEIVKADPGAGYALCLEVIDIICQTDGTATLNEDTTALIGPMDFQGDAGAQVHLEFKRPVQLTANTALHIDTSAAMPIAIVAQGFTIKTNPDA